MAKKQLAILELNKAFIKIDKLIKERNKTREKLTEILNIALINQDEDASKSDFDMSLDLIIEIIRKLMKENEENEKI